MESSTPGTATLPRSLATRWTMDREVPAAERVTGARLDLNSAVAGALEVVQVGVASVEIARDAIHHVGQGWKVKIALSDRQQPALSDRPDSGMRRNSGQSWRTRG